MSKKLLKHAAIGIFALLPPLSVAAFDDDDFVSGVFVLNEDWYGHQNSTINMWYPGNEDDPDNPVFYRIFQYVNPGCELGCTSQYAQVFGDKIYIMSKQHKDPGAQVRGGRLTVVDAATMGLIMQFDVINPEGTAFDDGSASGGVVSGTALGDGRGCCGVTPEKVYLGTSNGIYVLDTQTLQVTGRIAGTENELCTGDENNIDGQGPLYQNQIGMMIRTQNYVFAIMQDKGVLVIDPVSDEIVNVIEGCFSTMVQSADGNIWVGENLADPEKTNKYGVSFTHYPYGDSGSEWLGNGLLCINPLTLETRRVTLTLPGAGVPQSWYAWTAGKLTASAKRNVLYFTYIDPKGGQATWFSDGNLFRYDIDKDETELIYNSIDEGLYFYSSSLRVSPVDDKLYAHFYVGPDIASKNWVYRRFVDGDNGLEPEASASLIQNYWYPAMFVFPDVAAPVVEGLPAEVSLENTEPLTIELKNYVRDDDTPAYAIITRLLSNSNPEAVDARLVDGNLVLQRRDVGTSTITVQFDSNGLTAEAEIEADAPSGIDAAVTDDAPSIYFLGETLIVRGVAEGTPVEVYDVQGRLLAQRAAGESTTTIGGLPSGVLVVRAGNKVSRVIR